MKDKQKSAAARAWLKAREPKPKNEKNRNGWMIVGQLIGDAIGKRKIVQLNERKR